MGKGDLILESDISEGSIWRMGAVRLVALLREGCVSSESAVASALSRIGEDPFNAFTTVVGDKALEFARDADKSRSVGRAHGPLHGLPIAVKDLAATKGIRTTFGSRRFADFVPERNEPCVERLLDAGAIIVGKTNTPEFGFGAVCDNPLTGPTANPWNPSLTSGGSSGGSAVAVTTGMVPLAHGTDFGGSVRTPASFCGCVGLRPTPGLIAEPTRDLAWNTLATHGVLARSVEDSALFLVSMVSNDREDPSSHAARHWAAPAPDQLTDPGFDARTARVAISATLGGSLILEPAAHAAFEIAADHVARLFPNVSRTSPDCTGGVYSFKTLRAALTWHKFSRMLSREAEDLTDSFVWNVEEGRDLTAQEYLEAEAARSRIYRNFTRFFKENDLLMLPTASVLPFPNSQREVLTIGDHVCDSIIDYLAPTFLVSLVGCPSISLPALWTDGLPFGIQIVGRPYEESALLAAAYYLQQEAGFRHRWPDQG